MYSSVILALALTSTVSAAASIDIAGYTPASDVAAHSQIDLDIAEMDTCLDGVYDWGCAYRAYANGGNSVKSSGAIRTLRGFATKDLSSEIVGGIYSTYWGETDYADQFIVSALNGTATTLFDFSALSDVQRYQLAMKGTQYQALWIYTMHEYESALSKCSDGSTDDDSGAPHAWDEGWAFYAGSREGTAEGGNDDGCGVYRLAEKRCGSFLTCGASSGDTSGTSYVNTQLLSIVEGGLANVQAAECDDASDAYNLIISQMAVPLVQGTLRYAYKCDPAALNSGAEACAEAFAFAAALLPLLNYADADVASTVYSELTPSADTSTMVPNGYANIKSLIESTYDSLDITCADVGGLLETATEYYSGMEPCSDSVSGAAAAPLGGLAAVAAVAAFFAL